MLTDIAPRYFISPPNISIFHCAGWGDTRGEIVQEHHRANPRPMTLDAPWREGVDNRGSIVKMPSPDKVSWVAGTFDNKRGVGCARDGRITSVGGGRYAPDNTVSEPFQQQAASGSGFRGREKPKEHSGEFRLVCPGTRLSRVASSPYVEVGEKSGRAWMGESLRRRKFASDSMRRSRTFPKSLQMSKSCGSLRVPRRPSTSSAGRLVMDL